MLRNHLTLYADNSGLMAHAELSLTYTWSRALLQLTTQLTILYVAWGVSYQFDQHENSLITCRYQTAITLSNTA